MNIYDEVIFYLGNNVIFYKSFNTLSMLRKRQFKYFVRDVYYYNRLSYYTEIKCLDE
jgi:hypothetical protein